jgi:hypothetical protein
MLRFAGDKMDEVKCKLCGEPIKEYEEYVEGSFCFGCKAFICEDHPQSPWGKHLPGAHDAVDGDDEGDDL